MSVSTEELDRLTRELQSVDEANCGRWVAWSKLEQARAKVLVKAIVDAYEALLRQRDLEASDALDPDTIYRMIKEERLRQDVKWGEQNHDEYKWLTILSEEVGKVAVAALNNRPWYYIDALIQVAAVAVVAIESADRSHWPCKQR